MKKIKGLIKRLTVIDFLIVLFMFGVALLFAFITYRKPTYTKIRLDIGVDDLLYKPWESEIGVKTEFAVKIVSGLRQTSVAGLESAKIIDVYQYDVRPGRKRVIADINLLSVYTRSSNQYSFNGTPLLVGNRFKISFENLLLEGVITEVGELSSLTNRKPVFVEAELKSGGGRIDFGSQIYGNLDMELYTIDTYNAIGVGDLVTDNKGNPLVKVLRKDFNNSQNTYLQDVGRYLTKTYTSPKDIYLDLELYTYELENKLYLFDNVPVVLGEKIPLLLNSVYLFPEISKIHTE